MIFQNISHKFRACYTNWFLSHAWSSLLKTQILQILLEALLTDFQLESKMRVFWSTQSQVEPSFALAQASVKKASTISVSLVFFQRLRDVVSSVLLFQHCETKTHVHVTAYTGRILSVIIRENRAGAKDRGRCLTSTFLPQESHLKRLSTVVFSEVDGFFI